VVTNPTMAKAMCATCLPYVFQGGTDGTWRHRGVRVESKLPVRRRGGRRITMKTGLDLYALELNCLTHLYSEANQGLCNSPVK
jgi:hypothetical protein